MTLSERSDARPSALARAYAEIDRLHAIRDEFGEPADLRSQVDALRAELEVVKNERDLAVLTLAAFTPADKPLPVCSAGPDRTEPNKPLPNASGKELANDPNQGDAA